LLGLHGRSDRAHHDDTLWHPQVLQLSALHGQGLDAFWAAVSRFRELQTASGRLAARRRAQDQAWLWERIEAGLRQRFREHPAVREALPQALADVEAGRMAPSVAARRLLDGFGRRDPASSTFPADPATSASPSPLASGASDASDASPDGRLPNSATLWPHTP
ncbi:MAG: hypothetical protein ACO305_18335, partial [Rubrivivax sp.]